MLSIATFKETFRATSIARVIAKNFFLLQILLGLLLTGWIVPVAQAQTTELVTTQTIDTTGSVGEFTSIGLTSSGDLAVSYYDVSNSGLELWVDDGAGGGTAGDGIANGTEIRTIESTGSVGAYNSLGLTSSGNLAVSYSDSTNSDLKLWVDDGAGGGTAGDGVANGTEIRTIDSAGMVGSHTSLGLTSSGNLAVSYLDDGNSDLELWVDDGAGSGIAGDGIANGAEIRTIDSTGSVGFYNSLGLTSTGNLAVSYTDFTNFDLKLWVDDGAGGGTAGDGLANGTEIRTIDSIGFVGAYTSLGLASSGNLVVSYLDSSNLDLKLWLDDGAGGGTAGDGIANGTEIRTIDSTGDFGAHTSLGLTSSGNIAVSYQDETNFDLKLWVDDGAGMGTAGDGIANGTEIRTIDSTGNVGAYTSLGLTSSGNIAVSYQDLSNTGLKVAQIVQYAPTNIDTTGLTGFDNSITTDRDGRLAVSYWDLSNEDLKLWVDDGAGGGTAGDRIANGSEIRGIDTAGKEGGHTSITRDANDHLAISYQDRDTNTLKLWVDDGAGMGTADDEIANGSEIRNIDLTSFSGASSDITVDTNGRLAVSYVYNAIGQLRLWLDDGDGMGTAGDGIANGTEIRTIDSTLSVADYTSITVDGSGYLAISYYDPTNTALKVWIDDGDGGGTAGNGKNDGTEIRTIDSTNNVGLFTSITTDVNGRLAVSYRDASSGDLKLWIDDGAGMGNPGDGLANGSEIRSIDTADDVGHTSSITLNPFGQLAISYYDATNTALKLWVDDGTNGGTAGDGVANGSEIRTVDSAGDVGSHTSITIDAEGFIAVSYLEAAQTDLKLFRAVYFATEMNVSGLANSIADGDVTPSTADDTDFSSVVVGSNSSHTFTIANSGNVLLNLSGSPRVELSGSTAFTVTTQPATSVASSGGTTTFVVQFAPTAVGLVTATVSIANDDSDEAPYTFSIQGTGVEPEMDVSGNSVSIASGDNSPSLTDGTDFDVANLGDSQSFTFTVSNSGGAVLNLDGTPKVSISGSSAFTVISQPTSPVAASGGTTTFEVQFSPTAIGLASATVSIANDDSNEDPYTFAIQGTGLAPEVDVTGNALSITDGDSTPSTSDDTDFGSVDLGSPRSITFTIANSGNDALLLTGNPLVSISGSSAFSVITQPSSPVAANGGTTSFLVQFAPTVAGLATATVSIDNSDSDENPYTFTIQGTGNDPVDTDGDGTPDSSDSDDDNDGVPDSQEMADGTNPLDPGSGLPTLPTTFCSEWNSFLGMLNVNEYSNLANSNRSLDIMLYNFNGVAQSMTGTSVLANSQRDVLVHDLTGFTPNSYGRTCTNVTNGNPGEVDGRTVFYHPDGAGFDFAISLPFFSGKLGSQYAPFNTYHPSLLTSNFVANWVSVTNDSGTSGSGTLFYYAQDGSTLGSETATLAAGGRRDFSAHQFGANRVGLVEWRPSDQTTTWVVRNIRYYYDNTTGSPSFNSAMQIEGAKPTGEAIVVPLDKRNGTAVLELSNATNAAITVAATFRNSGGTTASTATYNLAARSTIHVVADSILSTDVGSVTLDGSAIGSVIAVGVHYSRDASAELVNAYALYSREARGSFLFSSYNTFLGQGCDLILVNSTSSAVTSSITMTRFDGSIVANGEMVTTPANGVTNYNLCEKDTADNYGSVFIEPDTADSISGAVVRRGAADRYQFATELLGSNNSCLQGIGTNC